MIGSIIGAVTGLIGKAIDKAVPDKDEANRLKNQINSQILSMQADELKGTVEIITAEIQGESPAQRNWRPHLMYLIMGLLVFNGAVVPLISAIFNVTLPTLEAWNAIPGEMWTLLQIGLGGYIVGRSGEKIVKNLQSGKD